MLNYPCVRVISNRLQLETIYGERAEVARWKTFSGKRFPILAQVNKFVKIWKYESFKSAYPSSPYSRRALPAKISPAASCPSRCERKPSLTSDSRAWASAILPSTAPT